MNVITKILKHQQNSALRKFKNKAPRDWDSYCRVWADWRNKRRATNLSQSPLKKVGSLSLFIFYWV